MPKGFVNSQRRVFILLTIFIYFPLSFSFSWRYLGYKDINMKDFDKICRDFENIDINTYAAVLTEKASKLIPALSAFSEDGLSGVELFASFIYGAIAADGKLSEDEYALIYPLLHSFFGDTIDYNDAKRAFSSLSKEHRELKKIVDDMVDVIGCFSDEMKTDIVIVAMLICAVDGKISFKEKNWIKKLID